VKGWNCRNNFSACYILTPYLFTNRETRLLFIIILLTPGKIYRQSLNFWKKIRFGDIIVAPITTPDMIVALRLAKGIITDEGGITCHAAIVSRELKKPCVIGTKTATKQINDGDLIEITGDNERVKIISRRK
jgi:phosphoenolpyruvate synthase/pyruvate phosphate dikinase